MVTSAINTNLFRSPYEHYNNISSIGSNKNNLSFGALSARKQPIENETSAPSVDYRSLSPQDLEKSIATQHIAPVSSVGAAEPGSWPDFYKILVNCNLNEPKVKNDVQGQNICCSA